MYAGHDAHKHSLNPIHQMALLATVKLISWQRQQQQQSRESRDNIIACSWMLSVRINREVKNTSAQRREHARKNSFHHRRYRRCPVDGDRNRSTFIKKCFSSIIGQIAIARLARKVGGPVKGTTYTLQKI